MPKMSTMNSTATNAETNTEKPATSRPRPLSPHLQVYSWLITSTLSIFHRLTGVVLSIGLLYLAVWLVIAAYYPQSYDAFADFSASPIGILIMAGWSVALYYHLFNGIRHLFWDMGKGFELKNVTRSGVAVLILTVIFTSLTWAIAMKVGK